MAAWPEVEEVPGVDYHALVQQEMLPAVADGTDADARRGEIHQQLAGAGLAALVREYLQRGFYPTGQKVAEAWDYTKDVAAGNECKAYGAGGIMRMPTRLRIAWQDDTTLKIDTDTGTQTRRFHFAPAVPAATAGPRA